MRDSVSPEEKLLKLIKKDKLPPGASPVKDTIPHVLPLSQKKETFHFSLSHFKISMPDFYKIAWPVYILVSMYFLYNISYSFWGLRKIKFSDFSESVVENSSKMRTRPQVVLKPFEYYLNGIRQHQIFSQTAVQDTSQPAINIAVDLSKDFVLLGVIFDEDPQAIIENKRSQQTFYMRKGQALEGFQIEDIQEGKIVLDRNGQKFELHL